MTFTRKAVVAPAEHLKHLVGMLVSDSEEKAAPLKKCGDLKQRAQVIVRLNELQPGLRAELEKIWTHSGGVALHLWRARVLDKKTVAQLKKLIQEKLGITLTREAPVYRQGVQVTGGDVRRRNDRQCVLLLHERIRRVAFGLAA